VCDSSEIAVFLSFCVVWKALLGFVCICACSGETGFPFPCMRALHLYGLYASGHRGSTKRQRGVRVLGHPVFQSALVVCCLLNKLLGVCAHGQHTPHRGLPPHCLHGLDTCWVQLWVGGGVVLECVCFMLPRALHIGYDLSVKHT